jgi:hypothetical protein
MPLHAAKESMMGNVGQPIAFLDKVRNIRRMESVGVAEKRFVISRRIVTEAANEAQKQNFVFDCNCIAAPREMWRWTSDKNRSFAIVRLGATEERTTVSCVHSDNGFSRPRESY